MAAWPTTSRRRGRRVAAARGRHPSGPEPAARRASTISGAATAGSGRLERGIKCILKWPQEPSMPRLMSLRPLSSLSTLFNKCGTRLSRKSSLRPFRHYKVDRTAPRGSRLAAKRVRAQGTGCASVRGTDLRVSRVKRLMASTNLTRLVMHSLSLKQSPARFGLCKTASPELHV